MKTCVYASALHVDTRQILALVPRSLLLTCFSLAFHGLFSICPRILLLTYLVTPSTRPFSILPSVVLVLVLLFSLYYSLILARSSLSFHHRHRHRRPHHHDLIFTLPQPFSLAFHSYHLPYSLFLFVNFEFPSFLFVNLSSLSSTFGPY